MTSSTSSSAEPEIITTARAKAEYIREEMAAEYNRFCSGGNVLTAQALHVFERKWTHELKEVEDRIFTVSLSPDTAGFAAPLQQELEALRASIGQYLNLLRQRFQPDGEAPHVEPGETEKERKRRERRERMARYQRGEKPQ
jgi:hypothetical protein